MILNQNNTAAAIHLCENRGEIKTIVTGKQLTKPLNIDIASHSDYATCQPNRTVHVPHMVLNCNIIG